MGIGVSIFLFAIGAVLTWAVEVETRGVSLETVGVILMIVGAVGLLVSLLFFTPFGGEGRGTHDDHAHGSHAH